MKKKNILLFLVICMFIFISNIKANDVYSIECEDAVIDSPFACEITTNEPVYVYTDLQVYEGSTKISKKGSIKFKANEAKDYDIALVSEDGLTTYKTITINVKDVINTTKTTTTKAKSDNNYLSTITIDGKVIDDFSKNTSKYFVEVENDVTKVTLNAKAEDENAKVEVDGPSSLQVGDNEYTISVTSENDTTKFYKVIVTRLDEEESSNTRIKNIKIKGYRFNFDRNSKTFYLNIDKEDTELDITVTLSDNSSSYEIEDNENLEDGSVIKIVVTAEDGNTDTYRIIIEKKETNYVPYIITGIFIAILLLLIVLFIIKKNKKKKIDNKKETNKKRTTNESNINKNKYQEEKTIKLPAISDETVESNDSLDDFDVPLIDNDEEEETRILSYAEREELERTKALNDEDIGTLIDKELEKKLSSNEDDEEEYY